MKVTSYISKYFAKNLQWIELLHFNCDMSAFTVVFSAEKRLIFLFSFISLILEIIAHYFEVYVVWIWLWGRGKLLAKLSCVKLLLGNVIYQKNCDCSEQLTSYHIQCSKVMMKRMKISMSLKFLN